MYKKINAAIAQQIIKKTLISLLILLNLTARGQKTEIIDLTDNFKGYESGMCIYDMSKATSYRYNDKQCKQRFSPCSTFKIPNSLMGIESGIISDTSFVIQYDSIRHPKDSSMLAIEPFKHWFKDLSMRNAFKYSCVFYYQELARRLGPERMARYIGMMHYGNQDLSGGEDSYWLCSSLQISIDEQIEFLKKLYLNQLEGFSEKSTKAVKSMMLNETGDTYKIFGKTGTGTCLGNKVIAWYVGYVETNSGTYIFAMNMIVDSFDDLKNNLRLELTKNAFKNLKLI